MEVLEDMVSLERCELAYCELGYRPEEIDELRRIIRSKRSINPFARRAATERHDEFRNRFHDWKTEPFRTAPPLTDELEETQLQSQPLLESVNDLTFTRFEEEIHLRLANYHLSPMHKLDNQKFQRILVFQRSHEFNNTRLGVEYARLEHLLQAPDRAKMTDAQWTARVAQIFRGDKLDDEQFPSHMSFMVVAGPAAVEDMGNYLTYKDIFDSSVTSPAGLGLVKTQIAFPQCWPDLMPRLLESQSATNH